MFARSRVAAVVLCGSILACAPEARPPRLVLLYATCSVGTAQLAAYDANVEFTPFLERFARDAVVFDRHQTEAGVSGIAYASLFSGQQADHHGVYFHPTRMSEDLELIGESFSRGGFETFFWAGHPMASPALNYGQGFAPANTFRFGPDGPGGGERFLVGKDPRFLEIIERLRADPSYRAFVLTNFTVTHSAYGDAYLEEFCGAFPARCAGVRDEDLVRYGRLMRRHLFGWMFAPQRTEERLDLSGEEMATFERVGEILYQSNVYHLDRLFGGVLEVIRGAGLMDESAIAFTADHGELLSRDNARFQWIHGFQLAPEVLEVPLLLLAPGVRAGRYPGVSRSVDVFPILAGLARVPPPAADLEGVDLSPALRGEVPPPELLAFSHTTLLPTALYERGKRSVLVQRFPAQDPRHAWVAVREGDRVFKLTSETGEDFVRSVYDWGADPEERSNLFDPASSDQAAVFARLERYKQRLVDAYRPARSDLPEQPAPHERESLLRRLGYVE